MRNTAIQTTTATQPAPPPRLRKPYHAPRLEDFGEINELTRSSLSKINSDGTGFASSFD
jgi:hypothetical protein